MGNKNFSYRKILVIGNSGAGKTTFATEMSKKLNIPVIHLDRIWWLADWKHRTRDEFDNLLERELNKNSWIIDGDYSRTFKKRLEYADFCVFLDYPPELCLRSAYERYEINKGKTRPDMADGCIEQLDSEFEEYIKSYNDNTRPKMLNELINSGISYKIFTDREQARSWLNALQ